MSVLRAMEFLPEAQARPDAQPADTREAPSLLEQFLAGTRVEADRVEDVQEMRRGRAYEPLFDALVERGVDRKLLEYGQPGFLGIGRIDGGQYRYDYIWREAKAAGIEGLPATREEFERQAYRRDGGRDADLDTLARGGGVGGTISQFAGGMAGSFADPINVYTLPFGGAGKTVAARILSEGAVNAGIEALQLGPNSRAYARMGEDYGAGEAARDIGLAFAGGAAFRGAIEVAPGAARAVDDAGMRALAPLRDRIDSFFADRDAARAFAEMVPEHLRTPEQEAALRILTREGEIDAATPFARTYEGGDAHHARLHEAGDAVMRGQVAPRAASVDFSAAKRAIRGPESAGDDAAVNALGSSASGRYQFIEGTFTNLYRKVFRVGEREAAAAWRTRRFDPAVQERLMDQLLAENTASLRRAGATVDQGNLYLAHVVGGERAGKMLQADPDTPISRFMSPEAIAQNPTYFGGNRTVGEAIAAIRSRVGADGAGGRAIGGSGESDAVLAALDAERADIEMARARNAAEDAQTPDAAGLGEADRALPPPLARGAFPDETSWRIAQAEADAVALGTVPAIDRQSVWEEARDQLLATRAGEVPGALYHPDIGPIDVKWGNAKGGLAHIIAKHEDVIDHLPAIIAAMEKTKESPNRIHLESADHVAKVRLDYDGKAQHWLLTAFTKDRKAPPAAEDGGAAGIATRQDRSPGAGAGADIGVRGEAGKLSPGELLANYWGNARDPQPVFVARDAAGEVVGWSRHGGELGARVGGEGVTIRPEAGPGGESVDALASATAAQDMAKFDDPAGDGIRQAAESDWHDLRADPEFATMELDLEDGKGARTLADIEAEIAEDRAAIAALRSCMT